MAPSRGDQRKLNAELTDRFNYFDGWRQQWDNKAIEWYKLFVGHKEPIPSGVERSNLHIPKTYESIDTIRARLVKAFFNTRPYIDFIPLPDGSNPETMDVAEKKAEVASALVDQQLCKNNIVKLFYDFVTSFLVFPAAIMSVGWRYEEKMVKKPVPTPFYGMTQFGPQLQWTNQMREELSAVWDDNEIAIVDYFDFWPDPRGTNIDNARGVFQREWVTEEQLVNIVKWLMKLPDGQIFPIDIDKLKGSTGSLEEGTWQRLSAVGIEAGRDSYQAGTKLYKESGKELYELLHYWEDDRRTILVNRQDVIYDGPSPYWRHQKKPYIVESYDPLPNEFYGLSAVQIIHDLQHELNTQHNQRVDNVSFALNKMWKARRGADIKEEDLISRAGGVIYLDDMDDLDEFQMTDVTSSSYNETSITERQLENVLAVPPVIRGVDSTKAETATEASLKSSNASIRYDVRILLFESLGIKRLAQLMDLNNQQFINEKRLIRLGPEESVQWRTIEPGELIGEFDYRPAGTSVDPAANKEIRRQQLSQMLAFLIETGNPYVDLYELTKAWMESFDLRNIQKFLFPRELVNQMLMASAPMQGEEGPPGGGAPPPSGTPPGQGPPGIGLAQPTMLGGGPSR